jgi:hypothetical protein
LDVFDVGVLVSFLALSSWIVVVLLHRKGPLEVWTGTNGLYIGDQMQFLGWIRDSAAHVLVGNPFDTIDSPHDYLNPGLVISGMLTRLGVGAWLSYLLWIPVAAVALFFATRALVHRLVAGKAKRRCALVLALFYFSATAWLAVLLHSNLQFFLRSYALEMWPGMYLWGYPFTALAVACMIGALLSYERDRDDRRVRFLAPSLALICAWLQPWQGATVILIVTGSEGWLWLRTRRRPPGLLGWTLAAAVLPLGYYSLLSHFDASWALSGRVNLILNLPARELVVAVLPLAVCAVLAYWRFPLTFGDLAVRTWPLAAFALFWFIPLTHIGTFPEHSLQGLSVPFAVLAVLGTERIHFGRPALRVIAGSLIVVALVGPSLRWVLNQTTDVGVPTIFGGASPFLITQSEQDALNYLEHDPTPGAVLANVYLGQTVPAETGRNTWVGIASWTPHYSLRTIEAYQLFSGQLSPSASVALVRASRARFLLADCQDRFDLTGRLGPMIRNERHIGCATVYQVRFDQGSNP